MPKTAADVLKLAKEEGVDFVDFRFVDMLGTWQHTSKSIDDVDEDTFTEGVGFDGSSIRGFQAINECDMLMMPIPQRPRSTPFFPSKRFTSFATSTTRSRMSATAGPARCRASRRGVSENDRYRRHRLFRTRARILRLRQCPLLAHQPGQFPGSRLHRGLLEHRAQRKQESRLSRSGRRAATTRCRLTTP